MVEVKPFKTQAVALKPWIILQQQLFKDWNNDLLALFLIAVGNSVMLWSNFNITAAWTLGGSDSIELAMSGSLL